jgi:metal-responsive CopG/Arc/MetJ family transcriptional regulator
MNNTQSKAINITVPKELLEKVDALAKQDYTSRSDIIRQALLDKIRKPQPDEWGEEGKWNTLVDFREISSKGVPASDVLEALKKIEKARSA